MSNQMGLGMFQQQTQKLFMTQQLRQAITLLQFSSTELLDYLLKEAEENPVLDIGPHWQSYSRPNSDLPPNPLEFLSDSQQSLEQILLTQLGWTPLPEKEKRIGRYLIGLLDPDGYFRQDLEMVALELKTRVQDVEKVLRVIQTFEPAGVGARNLQECLLIQMRQKGIRHPLAETIVSGYLPEVAERRYARLAKLLGVPVEEIESAVEWIKSLDPIPGIRYSRDQVRYITPDVYVEKEGDQVIVYTNDRMLPRLTINPYYRQILKMEDAQAEAKRFIREKFAKAAWLVRSIEQRRMTILRVTEAIFQHQIDFFEKGFLGLKPLTLQEIARWSGLHESTVSRAISGKHVQTPRGLYELKQFFVNGLMTASGGRTSTHLVKMKIRELIAGEEPENPLSDQQIADRLNGEGIQISRRTVVKYREQMMIPSSHQRRRQYV